MIIDTAVRVSPHEYHKMVTFKHFDPEKHEQIYARHVTLNQR